MAELNSEHAPKSVPSPCCSLKLECDKLASEKSEMQRHYVMVSLWGVGQRPPPPGELNQIRVRFPSHHPAARPAVLAARPGRG